MKIVCCDFEGVFVPEVWINVARKTGIEQLKLTTRDIQDYDELMTMRLKILKEHNLTLKDIQEVIKSLRPLEGAREMLDWIRQRTQIIIVSDTFEEFARPLLEQLGWPTLFCHNLSTDPNGTIIRYNIRQKDPKRQVIKALHGLNYKVIAFGDSYNDVTMLEEADRGILFKAPSNVKADYPYYPAVDTYDELKAILTKYFHEIE